MASHSVRHAGRQFKLLTIGVLAALVWMSGKASAAQCGGWLRDLEETIRR
jgi:hypothetical protein